MTRKDTNEPGLLLFDMIRRMSSAMSMCSYGIDNYWNKESRLYHGLCPTISQELNSIANVALMHLE